MMAKLALYTLRYIDKSAGYKDDLFKNDPDFDMTKYWANRQEYLAELFASDDALTFNVGDKKTYPHKVFRCSLNEKIIIMRFANVKEMLLERNFVEEPVEYNPSCYVIIDNRDGCRRVVIQKISTAFTTTDQVAKVMEQVISEQLKGSAGALTWWRTAIPWVSTNCGGCRHTGRTLYGFMCRTILSAMKMT